MEVKTNKPEISLTLDNKARLTFTVPKQLITEIEELNDDITLIVKNYHSKRTLTQNAYMWSMINKLAVKVNETCENVYKSFIRDYGVRDFDNSMLGAFNNPVEAAREKFEKNGYKLPKLVFWNVASRTGTIPIEQNDLGFLLISGFSQNLFNGVAAGKRDTREMLNEVLISERYSKIEKIIFKKDVDKED